MDWEGRPGVEDVVEEGCCCAANVGKGLERDGPGEVTGEGGRFRGCAVEDGVFGIDFYAGFEDADLRAERDGRDEGGDGVDGVAGRVCDDNFEGAELRWSVSCVKGSGLWAMPGF